MLGTMNSQKGSRQPGNLALERAWNSLCKYPEKRNIRLERVIGLTYIVLACPGFILKHYLLLRVLDNQVRDVSSSYEMRVETHEWLEETYEIGAKTRTMRADT